MKLSQLVDKSVQQQEVGAVHFAQQFDVIVVGLGTAGAIAAIVAARNGLKVLGLESLHCMGGTHTAGAIRGYYFGARGGLYETLDEEIRELLSADGYSKTGGANAELKKLVLEKNALDAGVTISYESTAIGVYLEEKTVRGLRWISPDGVFTASAKIVIDCTSNAEICAMAGCEIKQGRAVDGQPQPFSNVLEIAGEKRVGSFYTDSGYVDPSDGDDLSRAIIDSAILSTHLKDRYDAEDRMLRLAPLLGVREGRFIIGEDEVTLAAFQSEQLTSQPLFYGYSNLDNHSKDVALESIEQQDWIVGASLWGLNFSVPVPLGAMIPRGFDGLLAAGRHIALDHDIAACVRMNRDMQKCGEAAAVAAVLALEYSAPLKAVPYELLAARLRETGCLNENDLRFVDTSLLAEGKNVEAAWLTDAGEIRDALASDKPGIAIWSCRRLGEKINAELREWAGQRADENLRKHSALALALQNDRAALPALREMIREKDSFVPKTSRKYNQVRGHSAIYLAGKLEDPEIVPELMSLLEDRNAFANQQANTEFVSDDEELFCQTFTFSLMALLRIGEKHADLRGAILERLHGVLRQDDFSLSFTLKGSNELRHELTPNLRRIVDAHATRWARNHENAAA